MANLGVFRDDFYNAIHVLPASQGTAGPTSTGTLTAAMLTGALENVITVGNGASTAQTYTTDTAVNIIAQIQAAVSAAYKANVGGFASSLGAQPAIVWPNFFNVTWTVDIANQGTTSASTLSAGTGVTLAYLNSGFTSGAGNLAVGTPNAPAITRWVVSVTSAQTITMTRVQ